MNDSLNRDCPQNDEIHTNEQYSPCVSPNLMCMIEGVSKQLRNLELNLKSVISSIKTVESIVQWSQIGEPNQSSNLYFDKFSNIDHIEKCDSIELIESEVLNEDTNSDQVSKIHSLESELEKAENDLKICKNEMDQLKSKRLMEIDLKDEEIKKLNHDLEKVIASNFDKEKELDDSKKNFIFFEKQKTDEISQLKKELLDSQKTLAETQMKLVLIQNNDNKISFRECSEDAARYASIAVHTINLVKDILAEIDKEIKSYYTEDDDANYFYVKRRLKFAEATNHMESLRRTEIDLSILANHRCVIKESELSNAISMDQDKEMDSLSYYIYNVALKTIVGPALILIREMKYIKEYVGVEAVNKKRLFELESDLVQSIIKLGYKIIDVELFKPLPLSNNIDCIGQVEFSSDDEIENGSVVEITKLAVLYGSAIGNTEVVVKK